MSLPLKYLKALRTRAGLTQRQLAISADLDVSTIRRLENLQGGAQDDTVGKIAVALGCRPLELYGLVDPERDELVPRKPGGLVSTVVAVATALACLAGAGG